MKETLRRTFAKVLPKNRRRDTRPGQIERIEQFESKILDRKRDVTIYLPPGYDERPERRYPVLYLHDGQNLFDPERAFIPGQHWRVREAADEAIAARRAEPMIIVGIDNAGPARLDEYTPTHDEQRSAGGTAAEYGRMLIEELKPIIDAGFRTEPAANRTGLGGSSLGGLVTLFLGLEHPDVFGILAVVSPSVWWHGRAILDAVDRFDAPVRPRIWLDIGLREGEEAIQDARTLNARLRAKGWTDDDLRFYEDRRADHSERAWAARIRIVLEYLFPPQT